MTDTMKAAVFMEPGRMEVHEVPKPTIEKPGDAIVRVLRACVCGSDLWWFRGISPREHGTLTGHEAIGIIDETGSDVTTLTPGDFVIVPFTHACGHCPACLAGFDGNCMNMEPGGNAGYQAEYMRVYNADTSLVKVPGSPADYPEEMLRSILSLSDVMTTGYHAATSARVAEGGTAVVMGDGAVGLCGVLSARLMGARRIIATSRHADRQAIATAFGATDIVPERGDGAVKRIMELTEGAGADSVLECVGTAQSTETAVAVVRPGGTIGRVGVPHGVELDVTALYWRNVTLSGGIASAHHYAQDILLDKVLDGSIDPGKIFTGTFDLDHIQDAYEAMDKRTTVKSQVIVSEN